MDTVWSQKSKWFFTAVDLIKDVINPYKCLLKTVNFLIKTTND